MLVKIFFCYSHEDEELLDKLKAHLKPLQRQRIIDFWYDREIEAGTDWESEIKEHLNKAQIILLLISPSFMNSDYCYSIEMKRAIERHKRGQARTIPIILRPVYWQGVLGKLQALPTDGKPIVSSSWQYQDEALLDVVKGIRRVINHLPAEEWKSLGNIHFSSERYKEALEAYKHAVKLDPNDALIYYHIGFIHYEYSDDEKALAAIEQAIKLKPDNPNFYLVKAKALCGGLGCDNEALIAIDRAIELHPNNSDFYAMKASILQDLRRFEEASLAQRKSQELSE